ncbi:Uncharacterised protein [Streptococcus suis]|uniref:Uncharacterized protein n=1 Tax=Streptococcus suis TaxID=1307 RepID=A0A123SUE3_STRSU|nr:Uncharacterised protein [Streptococcus suis]
MDQSGHVLERSALMKEKYGLRQFVIDVIVLLLT